MESKVKNRAEALQTQSQQNLLIHWLSKVLGNSNCYSLNIS